MLTARDALSDKERAFISGTDDYVTKPFEVKELILEFVRYYVDIISIQIQK